jgi:hypothetical protein
MKCARGSALRKDDESASQANADLRGPRNMPSAAFFETRSENALSASLHFSSAWAFKKWRGILTCAGTSNYSRCR